MGCKFGGGWEGYRPPRCKYRRCGRGYLNAGGHPIERVCLEIELSEVQYANVGASLLFPTSCFRRFSLLNGTRTGFCEITI